MDDTLSLDLNKRYTYADYLTWWDDKRRELINGFIKMMSPAPKSIHQEISVNLISELRSYIKKYKGKCKVYVAPFDVRLPKNGETADSKVYTVVQPDLCVVCDPAKLDENGCLGAPDMIAEIRSESTARYDLTTKFYLYESVGVREYWVVIQLAAWKFFSCNPTANMAEALSIHLQINNDEKRNNPTYDTYLNKMIFH
jgi:Uma2 family endonuclease